MAMHWPSQVFPEVLDNLLQIPEIRLPLADPVSAHSHLLKSLATPLPFPICFSTYLRASCRSRWESRGYQQWLPVHNSQDSFKARCYPATPKGSGNQIPGVQVCIERMGSQRYRLYQVAALLNTRRLHPTLNSNRLVKFLEDNSHHQAEASHMCRSGSWVKQTMPDGTVHDYELVTEDHHCLSLGALHLRNEQPQPLHE